MLLLSAAPALAQDKKPRNFFRGFGTHIAIDHRKNKIEPCGHPSGCPDRTVNYEDSILLHTHLRKSSPEAGRLKPMRRRTPTIKKAGFSENIRAVAK
jgi:hypothetical protein